MCCCSVTDQKSTGGPLAVSEIFVSIQGEGKDCGTHALFIRLSGCNLKCEWCDTKHSWEPGATKPQAQLVTIMDEYRREYKNNYIVWTGGEPLLQQDKIYSVISKTKDFYHHLETNGTIIPDRPYLFNSISVSPKTDELNPRWLTIKNATVKLVVDDITTAIKFQEKNAVPPNRFFVMAKSIPLKPGVSGGHQVMKERYIARECINFGFNFSTRLQAIFEWGIGQ